MNMVEIVARAVCAGMGCGNHKRGMGLCIEPDGRGAPCRATRDQLILGPEWPTACDAIAAMRSPTEAMCTKGAGELLRGDPEWQSEGPDGDRAAVESVWQVMCDSALSEAGK